jgi:hypothetical protein
VPQSTYDLSAVLRALGVRTARAVPSIAATDLLPVVVVGDFSTTFAAEVVESRAVTPGTNWSSPAGFWSATYLHALSPGGIVVENFDFDPGNRGPIPNIFTCSLEPFTGTLDQLFPIGGGSIASRSATIVNQPLATLPDFAGALGPGLVWSNLIHNPISDMVERWYVPPGKFIGTYQIGQLGSGPVIRFREIPEAQGPI